MLGTSVLFAIELVVLYTAGSYVMGRLIGISGFGSGGSALGRIAFYLLVFPGVVLHEGAHYLACLLTGTKVVRFAPFSPQRATDSRLVLGYVRHERRADGHAVAFADHQDLVQLDLGADVGDELFDAQGFALRHAVLATAGDDDSVHGHASVVILESAFATDRGRERAA